MVSSIMQHLAFVWLWATLSFFWVVPGVIVMWLITPKVIVERYFKQPHFNSGEIYLLAEFPGVLMRTLIFMSACFNPRYRKGRQLDQYLVVVPVWYQTTSKVVAFLMLGHGFVMAALLIFLGGAAYLDG